MTDYVIQAGDVGFAYTKGTMGWLIRAGEHLKGVFGSEWNHEFIVSKFEDGQWWIIQATLKGVIESPLESVAPGGHYVVIAPPPECDRAKILEFAYGELGAEYGVGTIIAIAIDLITWQWFPAFRGARKSSWICSALTCEALRFGGWLHEFIDIYTVTPSQSYQALVE